MLLHAYILIPEIRTFSSTFIVTITTFSLSSLIIVFSRMRGNESLKKCYPAGLPTQSLLMPESDSLENRYYMMWVSKVSDDTIVGH